MNLFERIKSLWKETEPTKQIEPEAPLEPQYAVFVPRVKEDPIKAITEQEP